LKSEGSFIDAELVIRANKVGYHIVQVADEYFRRTRGVSQLASPGFGRDQFRGRLRDGRRGLHHSNPASR
jgi:hypothetical protein